MPSQQRWIWAIPLLMTLHNAEKAWRGAGQSGATPAQLAIAVALLGAVVSGLAWWAGRGRPNGRVLWILWLAQSLLAWNALGLVWLAAREGRYQPGLVTALLVLPFSVGLARRALREGWVRARSLGMLVAVSGALFLAMAVGSPRLQEWLESCRGCA